MSGSANFFSPVPIVAITTGPGARYYDAFDGILIVINTCYESDIKSNDCSYHSINDTFIDQILTQSGFGVVPDPNTVQIRPNLIYSSAKSLKKGNKI